MMKKFISFCFLLCLGFGVNAQSYCLEMTEVSNDGQNLILKISMQGDMPFNLGTSNLQFSFSEDAIANPVLHESVMEPPTYFNPTVTLPFNSECSFNIELAFPETGMEIAASPNWTELGYVKFDVVNSALDHNLSWSYNGGTTETVAFLDDETTLFYAASGDCLVVESVVGVEENSFFRDLSIYPNPASDDVTLAYSIEEAAEVSYKVYDALSRVVLEGNADQKIGQQQIMIDVRDYSPGQYMITLVFDDVVKTERFEVIR